MKTLILVDIQNDFLPTGALPVGEGDMIIPVVNKIQEKFDLVIATQDWHPANHKSFASNNGKKPGEFILLNGIEQIMWPDHCVQGTSGAELVPDLDKNRIDKIFKKGQDPEVDSYSGFFDNDHKTSTGLKEYLKEKDVQDIFVVGLALDYCVKYTALDGQLSGFTTTIVVDATRAVNMQPGDAEAAQEEMKRKGIHIITSANT